MRSFPAHASLLVAVVAAAALLQVACGAPIRMPAARDLSSSLPLMGTRGVWYGEADQVPKALMEAYGKKNTLPNCTTSGFDYSHYNPMDPHYTALFTDPANPRRLVQVAAGHKRTSTFYVTKGSGNRVHNREALTTKARTCFYWQPYVDMRTGELKAHNIRKTEYERLANGTVVSRDMSCGLTGNEVAGCTTVAANRVHLVSIATYRCLNGECLAASPAFQEEEEHSRR